MKTRKQEGNTDSEFTSCSFVTKMECLLLLFKNVVCLIDVKSNECWEYQNCKELVVLEADMLANFLFHFIWNLY
jgi:hypothetical protein